jgi:putative tricarboxylic transport membrane protein
MRGPDFWSGLLFTLLGIWLAYEGRDLGLGELREPGSGFILFYLGLIMAALSAGVMVSGLVAGKGTTVASLWAGKRLGKVLLVVAYLTVYAMLLEPVGFVPLTVLLLILLFKTVEPQGWTTAIVGSVVTTAVVYVVFGLGLGTQFPAGLLAPG